MLTVNDLGVAFGDIEPLSSVSFALKRGEILGIVGESGSGKSLTAMSVMGLLPLQNGRITRGSVNFDGQELTSLPEKEYRKLRGGRIGLITQNPMTSLDPLQKIGIQIDSVIELHLGFNATKARARTVELLHSLRIPEPSLICDRYPHQMSGGMKQRIVIAMALAADPDLLIADEPTTALDVTVQAQIIKLLKDLVKERDLALILITHDMSVVAQTCDKVVVMYAGRAIEQGGVQAIFHNPQHPYTQALIQCIPHGLAKGQKLTGIKGVVPTVKNYPKGCAFHPRCERAQAICSQQQPAFISVENSHEEAHSVAISAVIQSTVACHFPGEQA